MKRNVTNMEKSIFSERLKELRRKNDYKQSYVCENIKTLKTYGNDNIEKVLSNYENDKRSPSFETLVEFARFYNVTTDYLLGISDHENEKNIPIKDLIGLSDKSIEKLRSYIQFDNHNTLTTTLNALIEDDRILSSIAHYLYCGLPEKTAILPYELKWKVQKEVVLDNPGNFVYDHNIEGAELKEEDLKNIYLLKVQNNLKALLDKENKDGEK